MPKFLFKKGTEPAEEVPMTQPGAFSGVLIFVHDSIENRADLANEVNNLGGQLCYIDETSVTHVVIPNNLQLDEFQEIEKKASSDDKTLASLEWLQASIAAERLLEVSDYTTSPDATEYAQTEPFEDETPSNSRSKEMVLIFY